MLELEQKVLLFKFRARVRAYSCLRFWTSPKLLSFHKTTSSQFEYFVSSEILVLHLALAQVFPALGYSIWTSCARVFFQTRRRATKRFHERFALLSDSVIRFYIFLLGSILCDLNSLLVPLGHLILGPGTTAKHKSDISKKSPFGMHVQVGAFYCAIDKASQCVLRAYRHVPTLQYIRLLPYMYICTYVIIYIYICS